MMSDPASIIFRRKVESKQDFSDADSINVFNPEENEILQGQDEADIILDLDGWQHIIQDEEDLEFLRKSLEGVTAALFSTHENLEEWAYAQRILKAYYRGEYGVVYKSCRPKIEGYYVPNKTGCARTEGVSKIPLSDKRKYLPQYAKAERSRKGAKNQAAAADLNLTQTRLGPELVIKSARANRIAKRNSTKGNKADESMTWIKDENKARLSQFCIRTNRLRLRRSPIHGWGLFSETKVAAGDMVIEFVGEVVSQKVSEEREKNYLERGMGSSYLFTLDNGFVVDGTKKGNMSRFINNSCTPNIVSKIRAVDGIRRIFFFALREIETGKAHFPPDVFAKVIPTELGLFRRRGHSWL